MQFKAYMYNPTDQPKIFFFNNEIVIIVHMC